MKANTCPWCGHVWTSATEPKRCPDCRRMIEHYKDMRPTIREGAELSPEEERIWEQGEIRERIRKRREEREWIKKV